MSIDKNGALLLLITTFSTSKEVTRTQLTWPVKARLLIVLVPSLVSTHLMPVKSLVWLDPEISALTTSKEMKLLGTLTSGSEKLVLNNSSTKPNTLKLDRSMPLKRVFLQALEPWESAGFTFLAQKWLLWPSKCKSRMMLAEVNLYSENGIQTRKELCGARTMTAIGILFAQSLFCAAIWPKSSASDWYSTKQSTIAAVVTRLPKRSSTSSERAPSQDPTLLDKLICGDSCPGCLIWAVHSSYSPHWSTISFGFPLLVASLIPPFCSPD